MGCSCFLKSSLTLFVSKKPLHITSPLKTCHRYTRWLWCTELIRKMGMISELLVLYMDFLTLRWPVVTTTPISSRWWRVGRCDFREMRLTGTLHAMLTVRYIYSIRQTNTYVFFSRHTVLYGTVSQVTQSRAKHCRKWRDFSVVLNYSVHGCGTYTNSWLISQIPFLRT